MRAEQTKREAILHEQLPFFEENDKYRLKLLVVCECKGSKNIQKCKSVVEKISIILLCLTFGGGS